MRQKAEHKVYWTIEKKSATDLTGPQKMWENIWTNWERHYLGQAESPTLCQLVSPGNSELCWRRSFRQNMMKYWQYLLALNFVGGWPTTVAFKVAQHRNGQTPCHVKAVGVYRGSEWPRQTPVQSDENVSLLRSTARMLSIVAGLNSCSRQPIKNWV